MQVVSHGELVDDERYFRVLSTGVVPFPVGYTIQRPVMEPIGRAAKESSPPSTCTAVFTATILRGEDGPEFQVTRSDASDVVHHNSNISTVWRDAIIAAEAAYPELVEQRTNTSGGKGRGASAKGASTSRPVINGLIRFGLTSEVVLKQLRALPGGDALWAHAELTKKKASDEEGVAEVVEVLDSQEGGTATRKESKRGPKAKASDNEAGAVQSKASKKSASTKAAAVAVQKYVKCAVCGSESTPFCASTGKPHQRVAAPSPPAAAAVVVPCPHCGLISSFCSSTGKEHPLSHIPLDGANTGDNATAPGGKRPRKQTTGGPSAKRSKKEKAELGKADGTRDDDSEPLFTLGLQSESELAVNENGTKGKKPRGKKSKAAKNADGAVTGEPSLLEAFLRQGAFDESIKAIQQEIDEEDEKPKGYVYPNKRPPLTNAEQIKAKVAIQKMWAARLQESDGHVLGAPLIEGITLPVGGGVMAKTAIKRKGAPRRGKKPGSAATKEGDGEEEGDGEGDEDEDGDNDAENGKDANDDGAAAAAEADGEVSEAAGAPSHPLDVCDVSAKTLTGRRFLHFVTTYTSERAKNDLLRRDNNATSSPSASTSTSAAVKRARVQEAEEKEATSGQEVDGDKDASATQRIERESSVSPQPTQNGSGGGATTRGRSGSSKPRVMSKSRSPETSQKAKSTN